MKLFSITGSPETNPTPDFRLSSHAARSTLSIALASLLVACGGGTGADGNTTAGIEGTGSTQGSVTGFGSVFVGGVRFNTDEASFTINGQPAIEDDLQVGMIVDIDGDITSEGTASLAGSGIASSVTYDRAVLGPIESLDVSTGQLVILGQSVTVNDSTLIYDMSGQPITIDQLNINNYVEFDGLYDPDGNYVATYIRIKQQTYSSGFNGFQLDLEGMIRNMDSPQGFFTIGGNNERNGNGQLVNPGQLVDYSSATVIPTVSALVNGAFVELTGIQPRTDSSVLQAAQVTVGNPDVGGPGDSVVVEGIVSNFNNGNQFTVNGQAVDVSASQRTDSTNETLTNGSNILLKGNVSEGDVLQAQSFALIAEPNLRVRSVVESVDSATGRITVLGIPTDTTTTTQYLDLSTANIRRFNLSNLSQGNFIETRSYEDRTGRIKIVRIERIKETSNSSDESVVQGELASLNASNRTMTVLGVIVNYSDSTVFEDADGETISRGAFEATASSGDSVRAMGPVSNSRIQANLIRRLAQ